MKKKILLIVGIAIAVIVLAVALLISPIAKRYIEKNSVELVGRQITIAKLCVNIFTGGLDMQGFAMAAEKGSAQANFVELDTLSTRINLLSMLRSRFIVKKMHLSGLRVSVWQNQDKFNFDDIIAKFPSDTTVAEKKQPSQWAIGIYDIRLRASRVEYKDIAVGSDFDMNDISLEVPGIYFSEKSTDVGLKLKFDKGGELATQMSYDVASTQYKLNLKFTDYNIDAILPYVKQQFNVGKIGGLLTTDVDVVGNTNHIMEFTVSGAVQVSDIVATNDKDVKLVDAKSIKANISEINLIEERYMLDSLVANGVSALFEIDADGTNNFSTLFKESAPASSVSAESEKSVAAADASTQATASAMVFEIGVLNFNGGGVEMRDNMVPGRFVYNISNINFKMLNFNSMKSNNLKLSAMMNGNGRAILSWKGKLDDMNNQNIMVRLSNVNLEPLTPYMKQYFAYPIKSGNLSFTSQNIIKGGMLNGSNHLEAFKVKVGNKDKTLKPEYKIPFKTVLYVLADKNDRIDMSLPVSGNINSPNFSYRKLIIKTVLNLMVKVAAAPFEFMGGALGLNKGANLQQLDFAASQYDFTLEQYAKMKNIAASLKEHTELDITFTQNVNYTEATQTLAMGELKKNFYIKKNPAKADSLEMLDYEAISNISEKDPMLVAYADSLAGEDNKPKTLNVKAMVIYGARAETLLPSRLARLNTLLKSCMEKEGIAATHLVVALPTLEQMKAYKGSTMYKISIGMPGESTSESQNEADSTAVSLPAITEPSSTAVATDTTKNM